MKVKEVIEKLLKQNPESEAMFQDPNHGGPFSVGRVSAQVSEGEFPDDWDMPEGFEFVLLES